MAPTTTQLTTLSPVRVVRVILQRLDTSGTIHVFASGFQHADCLVHLHDLQVKHQHQGQEYQTPSASLVSAVVLGTLLGLTLLLFCCCCCTKAKPKTEQNGMRVIRPYRVQGEDSVMHFRRMTEADRMA
jgi:hypothetical protein